MEFLRNVAQKLTPGEGSGQVDIPTISGNDLLANALDITYFLAGVIAVIVIIIAGLSYATSAGDAGKIAKAKNQILFAVIGLVVVLSAFAVTPFIRGRF